MFKAKRQMPTASSFSDEKLLKESKAYFNDGDLDIKAVSGNTHATHLLYEMAARWFRDNQILAKLLTASAEIWYVDAEKGAILHGIVCTTIYQNGTLRTVGIEFDNGCIEEFDGSNFGTTLFKSEKSALVELVRRKILCGIDD